MDVGWNWITYGKDRELEFPASVVLRVGHMGEVLECFLMQVELFKCHF